MYIELIEELNIGFSTDPSSVSDEAELTESEHDNGNSLYVPCEGIHSVITGNFTYYEPNCIKESIPLWTSPYGIPIIYHHKEHDGTIIGRVKKAKYISKSKRTDTPALGLLFDIGDEIGKNGILNGTLKTVSIGAKALDLRCSICGHNIAKHGFCEHERGKSYDGKLCYWVVKKISPKEVSYVIVPSDKYAYSEKPLSEEQVIAISESEDNEVNNLKNNLFSDMLSASLAEAQEKKILNSNEKDSKDEPKVDDKPEVNDKPEGNTTDEPAKQKEEPKQNDEQKQDDDKKAPEKEDESKAKEPEQKETEDKNKEPEQKEDDKAEENDENKEVIIKDQVIKDMIKELQDKVAELSGQVTLFKNKYEEEKQLRESAEESKILMESSMKKEYVNKINNLRKSFGLAEKQEELQMASSLDMLENEFNSLNEIHNSSLNCVNKMSKIKSTVLVNENLDNTSKPIKESSSDEKSYTNLSEMKNRFYRR